MDPSLPWDKKDTELWTELVAQDWPPGASRSDGGHILSVRKGRSASGQKPCKNVCWEFNALGECFGPSAGLDVNVLSVQKPIPVWLALGVEGSRRTGQESLGADGGPTQPSSKDPQDSVLGGTA